jgi:class 3 adenylate cyclase/pimeloyl-ACP methyl ester carboxylesterase
MEPRIQYAKTSDGVNIAYSSFGAGLALVYTPDNPIWGISLSSWQVPEAKAWYERLARGRTLVRYDSRGTGESDRSAKDYSLEGLLRDLETVVDGLGLENFALVCNYFSGPVAIAYAARYPERVSHLILLSAYSATSTHFESSVAQALSSLRSMAGQEWELYVKTMVYTSYSSAGGDLLQRLAELYRRSVSPSEFPVILAGLREHDSTSLLSQVRAPTLVVHWRDSRMVPVEEARRIAASIPGAELVVLEGEDPWPDVGRWEAAMRAIDEFLGDVPAANQPAPAAPSAFRTVLFTDLVGHTEMMSRLGDERGRDVLREHERITREVLKANGGTEVKTMGDGFMASFGSVTKAVECAIALQRAFAERSEGERLSVRVGLNAGEPIEEDGDLFGATVILASRIAAKAGGGEILVADTVRGLCSGKGFLFADRGDFVAKGFEKPVRISEVSWRTEH